MNDISQRLLDDTRDLVQQTLRLLPNDGLRARLERALLNEFGTLEQIAQIMSTGDRFSPWSFQTMAPQRHEEWLNTLREEIAQSLDAEAPSFQLVDRFNAAITVLIGAQRILVQANRALQDLFEQGSPPAAALDRLARHEQVYQSPNLPGFECTLVTGQVIAGRNPLTERDANWMAVIGVTHILDLREAWEWASPRLGAEAMSCLQGERLHLPVRDMQAPTHADLEAACRFLDDAMGSARNLIYVHCRAGQERTAAILCAWYGRRYGLSYDESLAALRQRRPSLKPLLAQEKAVRTWLKNGAPGD